MTQLILKYVTRVALCGVIAAIVVGVLVGAHFLAEAWLFLPIVLEPFVGSVAAGLLALVPIMALVYLFLYAIKEA